MRFMKNDKIQLLNCIKKFTKSLEAKMRSKYAFAAVSEIAFMCSISGDKIFLRCNTQNLSTITKL